MNNKLLIGAVAGAALVYMCRNKMNKENYNKVCDTTNRLVNQAKMKLKDGLDMGKNKAEYLADRAEDMMN